MFNCKTKNSPMYIKVYFPSSVHLKLRNKSVKCQVIDLNEQQMHENSKRRKH